MKIVINNYKSDHNLLNEANESTRSSSQSTTSKRIDESNEQMTDLRLEINNSVIRAPNQLIVSRHDDSDIYDVPPNRMSPNIVGVVLNTKIEVNGETTIDNEDPNHIYDSPRK